MKLEIPEIKLKEGQGLFDPAIYPSPGMYIVDDGLVLHLVWWATGQCPNGAPIPSELIQQHTAAKERVGVRDKLSEEIHEMKAVIGNMRPEAGFVSENAMLKAIALVQDPSLAEKLLK